MSKATDSGRRTVKSSSGGTASSGRRPTNAAQRSRGRGSVMGRRRVSWAMVAAVAVVLILVGVIGFAVSRGGGSGAAEAGSGQVIPAAPDGPVVVAQTPKEVPDTSGISGVLAWSTEGWPADGADHPGALQHDHVSGPVRYAVTPPVGGPHSTVWMNAGIYTAPIPPERAVHNLEHGAVWITYDPTLSAEQVAALTAFADKQSLIPEPSQAGGAGDRANRFIDLSPWAGNTLPSPIVLSSWGHQLRVESPADPRMQQFVDTFRHSRSYTPEYGAAVDGVPVNTGGRPASH